MQIISAEVHNFKRIEVARIEPSTGQVVEVTGKNEQGKSSILDAIEAAMGGRRRQPEEPIRRGAEKARVVIDLGDLRVERIWTAKTDRLVVKTPDGLSYSKGQAKLDGLLGGLAFDPMEFMGMSPADQRETLLGVVGVDLEEIESRREAAYEERRNARRELKSAQARIELAPEAADGTPEEEVSLAEMTAELSAAMSKKDAYEGERRAAKEKFDAALRAGTAHADQLTEVKRLEDELEAARAEAGKLNSAHGRAESVAKRASAAVAKLVDPDFSAIQNRIAGADQVNAEVRKAKTRADLAFEVERLGIEVAAQQDAIDAIVDEKSEALKGAEMPVDGLEINDDGVAFCGLPLAQASMSRRVMVCTAIGAALNPELRIALVRVGNDLDDESLAAFYAHCQESGLQAWVERISGISEGALVIEEGKIKSQPTHHTGDTP